MNKSLFFIVLITLGNLLAQHNGHNPADEGQRQELAVPLAAPNDALSIQIPPRDNAYEALDAPAPVDNHYLLTVYCCGGGIDRLAYPAGPRDYLCNPAFQAPRDRTCGVILGSMAAAYFLFIFFNDLWHHAYYR